MDKYPLLETLYYCAPSFWEKIPSEIRDELMIHSTPFNYKKSNTIIKEGDYSQGLYTIRKGMVKIFITDQTNTEQIIHILGKDSIFGYDSLFKNELYPMQVTAISDCEIDLIDKTIFLDTIKQSPELNSAIISYASAINDILNRKLTFFERSPLPQRIALAMLLLNQSLELNGEIEFTREDLSSYVGTVIESLSRQLQKLKASNKLFTIGRKIVILDFDGLYKIATSP